MVYARSIMTTAMSCCRYYHYVHLSTRKFTTLAKGAVGLFAAVKRCTQVRIPSCDDELALLLLLFENRITPF